VQGQQKVSTRGGVHRFCVSCINFLRPSLPFQMIVSAHECHGGSWDESCDCVISVTSSANALALSLNRISKFLNSCPLRFVSYLIDEQNDQLQNAPVVVQEIRFTRDEVSGLFNFVKRSFRQTVRMHRLCESSKHASLTLPRTLSL
jgi:hypothetical protein